ncbi:MAG: deoxyhypusine synthase family protein, partial [Candidatus Latescibacteria bacterium]|nr:deoxyhypusine synthase family protein [Candidatus Latescibacterota bacterium]
GMNLAATKLRGHRLTVDPDLDVIETSAIVYTSEKNGAIVAGGGSPKNFYLQTQPTLSQIFKLDRGGQDYFIQITTDAPHWGGLSGATPQEAVSWGKIHPGELSKHVVVYSDSTIALPLLFSYICSVREPRPRKQLYLKRETAVNALKDACGIASAGR